MKKKSYIITVELINENDYEKLKKAIEDFGTYAILTKYSFAVVTYLSTKEVVYYLGDIIGKESTIFVIKAGDNATWINTRCSSDWLKKNLRND